MSKMIKRPGDAESMARLIEQKVYEAMNGADADFQPFFQPREVAKEIMARQNAIERKRFVYAYEDWGCLVCGTTERAHCSLGMCEPCHSRLHTRIQSSLQKRLDAAGKPQEFLDTAALAKQALLPSLPKLVYNTGNLLPAEPAEKYRTFREAATEVGVDYMTLQQWVRTGNISRPSVMLNRKSSLWTEQDMERLRRFVAERALFQESRRTLGEAARRVGINENTLTHWVRQGKIRPSISRGRKRYWSDEDIERLRTLLANEIPALGGGE